MKALPRLFPHLLLLLLAGLSLSGCVTLNDPEAAQEFRAEVVGTLEDTAVIGQTFISRRAGLNGIALYLRPAPGVEQTGGAVTIELYHSPLDTTPLLTYHLPHPDITGSGATNIPFPPRLDPPGQAYYMSLRTNDGAYEVMGRSEDAYPDGRAYLNGEPANADLSFRLTYRYGPAAVLADLLAALRQAWLILPLALTLWLPGQVLLNFWSGRRSLDAGQRTALAVGLSIAIIPLLMLWTTLAGLRWSRMAVWVAGFLLLAAFAGQTWRARRLPDRAAPGGWGTGLTLAVVFLFALAIRLAMVRDLAAPPWVDSVHHAMITRLIIEQGAFPASYAPFLPTVVTASYHPGFHSLVAVFHWLSGLELAHAMLLLGQVLNALATLAVYLFTVVLTKDRLAGLVAALITGLVTPMPAYYTSWGRYTQLASLLILPAAFALIVYLIESGAAARRRPARLALIVLAAIACGGLFVTHYRVVAFLGCLLLAYLLVQGLAALKTPAWRSSLIRQTSLIGGLGALSIALTLPWWPDTLNTLLIPKLAWDQGAAASPFFADFSWGFLTSALGKLSLGLAGLGLAWSLIRRRRFAFVLVLWTILMFLLANLGAFRLPGRSFINNTSVEILLFIPLSVLGGYLASQAAGGLLQATPRRWRRLTGAGLAAVALAVACFGARLLLPILNPVTMLFREADRPALDYIAEHVPPGETILINPFSWGYGLYAGNDGGYWIVPLAGRATLPPPVLYGLGDEPGATRRITELSREAIQAGSQPDELAALLKRTGIRYVYVGARGGAISPAALRSSPQFRLLYEQAGTYLFRLDG